MSFVSRRFAASPVVPTLGGSRRALFLAAGLVAAAMGCGGRAPLVDVLPAVDTEDVVGPYVVTATIKDGDGVIVRAEVLWSNGAPGAAVSAALTRDASTGRWQASIPGQPAGTTVRYVVEVEDDEGYIIVLPPRAMPGEPAAAYEFRVGP